MPGLQTRVVTRASKTRYWQWNYGCHVANQTRVQPGFKGFFFALTESEIAAAERLGSRHRVALFNNSTGELLITSVPEIISRAKSMNWQLSVQL